MGEIFFPAKLAPPPSTDKPELLHHLRRSTNLNLHQRLSNPADCGSKCNYRCSATSHKKPCLFFCNKCCSKCLCVPPGTYGNKQSCPCYNNWKTKEGGPKCP